MNYAAIKNNDIANGPGIRVSLFVSGCTHHCPGCFNAIAWDFNYGEEFTDKTIEHILQLMAPDRVQGLTLLGGEPFEPQNQGELVKLVLKVKEKYPKKNIWIYTGYLYEDIILGRVGDPVVAKELVSCADVIVDGRFVREKKNLSLRFRGSENQRLIDAQQSLQLGEVVFWRDPQKK